MNKMTAIRIWKWSFTAGPICCLPSIARWKKFDLCGSCKTNRYALKDEYGSFPILSHDDCTTTILNGKILNLIDHLEELDEIRFFRIQLTTETKEESKTILKQFLHKLKTNDKTKLFNPLTDTRGHFNKEIL